MISDITLGQFFPGYSVIHKLDPRTKILLALVFIVAVFVANNPVSLLAVTLLSLILVFISRISLSVIIKGLKPIIFILIISQGKTKEKQRQYRCHYSYGRCILCC